jgi:hypothetical protein
MRRLDGRTREARIVRETRVLLMRQVGGRPSPAQAALIETALDLKLRMAILERQFAETGTQTQRSGRMFTALANAYARCIRRLGRPYAQLPASAASASLLDYLDSLAA